MMKLLDPYAACSVANRRTRLRLASGAAEEKLEQFCSSDEEEVGHFCSEEQGFEMLYPCLAQQPGG